jgi:hypothetical protein
VRNSDIAVDAKIAKQIRFLGRQGSFDISLPHPTYTEAHLHITQD